MYRDLDIGEKVEIRDEFYCEFINEWCINS